MATLHLLCGLPGSGKTTLAKQLEHEHSALRLSADEWMGRIVGDGFQEGKREIIERIQAEVAQRALELGIDVILDFGVWSRAERDALRAMARAVGAKTRLYFLDVPYDELLRRLERRNADPPPHTFRIKREHLDQWVKRFEPPTPDELRS